MADSSNPMDTSGKLRESGISLRYPLTENPSSGTRLRFVKYNRFNPMDTVSETMTATINLPMPVNVPENYSILTTGHDMGIAGNINNSNFDKVSGLNVSDLAQMTKEGIGSATQNIKSGNFNAAGVLLSKLGGDEAQRTTAAFTGVVQNPHTTVIFEGVSLRSINLEWRFSARSEDESKALKQIYDTVKLQSHPEEIATGYALNYPDLLYVEFTGKAKEYMPKFQKAMVNNISITPDSSGGIPLFKSGAPVTYTFQITATETSILTRDTLRSQIAGGTE